MIKKLIHAACGILMLASVAQNAQAIDTIWCDDAIPAGAWTGANGGDSWNWVSSGPAPYSGALAHQSAIAAGIHEHFFSAATATLAVNTGESLYTYVYLDPANPPQEIMLEWFDGVSWSHAAYWGANLIPWGVNGTASQYPVGALPAAGQWARLEVPASAVALEGSTLSGMQFILYGGRATFDDSGKSSISAGDSTPPAVSLTAPAAGSTVSGSVAISANASDNVGVTSVQFKLDGSNLGSPFTVSPYSAVWNSTTAANGSHTLTAVASDAAGNQTSAAAITINVSNSTGGSTNLTAGALPSWVGTSTHNWKPRLGGVYWLDSRAVVKQAAPYLNQSSRPVLVDIKSDGTGFGYRFDLNTWDSQSAIHTYYPWDGTDAGTPATAEDVMNIFGATGNAEFILNIPIPLNLTNAPSSNWGYDGYGYTWQTPQFYAAMVQYLFGTAGPQSEWQGLSTGLDFFSQPASFNWADLRARRGHVNPYPVVAVIIGEEPYNLEGTPNGALYGPQAEKFRAAIRNRGSNVPLGLHVRDMGIVDDPNGGWFYPMASSLNMSDFSFIDLEHYYQFSAVPEDFKRTFPVSINPKGYQGWWMPQSTWKSDYTKFLWIVEDTRNAIRDDNTVSGLGDPNRWNMGFSEHGIQIVSQFVYNDMFSAMHWAGWLAESMRQNIVWDSGWGLLAEGFSTAAIQSVNGYVTRTPMFYAYQMAQDFYGFDYLPNSYVSSSGSTTDGQGNPIQYPYTTVRTFRDPASGNVHLFVLNQSTNSASTITGFENWNVTSWKQLSGASLASGNPLGVAGPEPIQTISAALPALGQSLVIPPISVNHIIISSSGSSTNVTDTTPPTVSLGAPLNGVTVSGSAVIVSANASDNVGVANVQFKLDGTNLGSAFTLAPYAGAWDSTSVADGSHVLTAVATDTAGNKTTATPITILVSNIVTTLNLPTVSVTATGPTATIGTATNGVFTFALSSAAVSPLTVQYTVTGTAVSGVDYTTLPASVTIPAGATSATATVVALGNSTGANPETVVLTLATNSTYKVGSPGSGTVTISAAPVILPAVGVVATVSTTTIGSTNYGLITFTRTGGTAGALAVNYTIGGTAVNGVDYSALGGVATIPAGSSSATATIVGLANSTGANPETVLVTLASSGTYTIGSSLSAAVTILPAPVIVPTVTVSATIPNATIGTTNYGALTFTRTGSTSSALTVNFALGGTAVKWTDYRRPEGDMPVSIVIPAGSSSYTMSIVAAANSTGASPLYMSLSLSTDPSYNVGSPGSATVNLLAPAVPPTVTVTASAPNASRVGPVNGAFTFTRTGSTTSPLTINYSLGGTATKWNDYRTPAGDMPVSITIPAGASSITETIVPVASSAYVGTETIILALSPDPSYTVDTTSSATINMAGNGISISSIRATGASMTVTWRSVSSKIYHVAYKNSLSATNWTDISGNVTATSTTTSWTDTSANKTTQRYYLVYVID